VSSTAATPLGLRNSFAVFPRVAEYSNPGLWASTTTWLDDKLQFVAESSGVGFGGPDKLKFVEHFQGGVSVCSSAWQLVC
jgi:hypothetical protein